MSLGSLLLSSKKDTELDALFTQTAPRASSSHPKRKAPPSEPSESKKRKVEVAIEVKKKVKSKGKTKAKEKSPTPDSSEDEGAIEETYERSKAAVLKDFEQDNSDSESDGEGDPTKLVHESVASKTGTPTPSVRKKKYAPPEETAEQRDSRTLFVGNLPPEIPQKKANIKQLKRHLLSFSPSAKIESIRFRSVAFQNPTSKLPEEDDGKKGKGKGKTKDSRARDRERVSAWKDKDQDETTQGEKKVFLTPSQKKRIAFINQDFHSQASSINAYVVLAHSPEASDSPSPYDLADAISEKADGSTFMERSIRVDVVGHSESAGNPKLSVFVGNLDFGTKEEDLRVFFEGLVAAERGPPDEGSHWVTRVRVVRDKETQMGKGFGYVQFSDPGCVDEMVAMEEGKIKFAKRKLRVARCKSTTKSATAHKASGKTSTPHTGSQPSPRKVDVRPGDPTLGSRIAHLSKEERKAAKSADTERLARRLEKKKARHASDKKEPVKMRDRVRKKPAGKADSAKPKPTKRAKSDQSLLKQNRKK